MPIGIDPKVDYAFKRLFGLPRNIDLLISLINALIAPTGRRVVEIVEIINPFNEKETDVDKLSYVDIKARDQYGRLFNVEIQLAVPRGFLARELYYWARLFQSQIGEGDDYTKLRPTISIVFVNAVLFPDIPGYYHRFQVADVKSGCVFSDDLEIHVVEFPKFDLALEQLTTPLEMWFGETASLHLPEISSTKMESSSSLTVTSRLWKSDGRG